MNIDNTSEYLVGTNPTIDLTVYYPTEKILPFATVLEKLESVVFSATWQIIEGRYYAPVSIEGQRTSVLLYHLDILPLSTYCLIFDEDTIVNFSRRLNKTIDDLMHPYVAALSNIEQAVMVGLGFETSIPKSLHDADLKSAGIAVAFFRNSKTHEWERKQFMDLVGHYL